uniref:CCHC-type domain-containing protein n=1 Tax=Fagus sylvatica TaxID=28930 RepID=A0A2N9GX63_FAGSY
MDKNELPKTVTTILNGHNYVLWSQDMRSFLKGHRLWRYVTGEIQAPVRSKDEEDTKFADRLEDWDCKNHQIITWFRHSTVPSIHQQFGHYENAKDVWDLLSRHYTTAGLSHEYQLWGLLVNMKQTPRQPINEFLSGMQSIWDQMEQSTHIVKDPTDAAILATKRDQFHLIHQLLSHETRLRTLQPHHPDAVLATTARPSSSSSSRNGPKYCKNCHKQGYLLAECPTIQCRYCHKIGHIVYNCPTKPPKPGQSGILPRPVNHSVAAAAEDSPSDPSLSSIPLFSSIIPTTHTPLIQTANGSHLAASHTGSVSTFTLSLSDTYLISNLTLNLISVGQLCELGFDLWFGSSGCRVQDPRTNQVLGTGRRVGRMFELTSLHLPTTSTPPPSHVAHTASVFPLSLWHLRLGTSQQNGRAERKHRHILDSVRAFLISASCPERFWEEAALTAVYTINRLPSSALQNVTPFERLYGTPASYSSLRVFGCACFVLLQPHEHSKLEPRSRLCCFLGYGIEHKGYRCWDPISQRLRISRHVVFWEHTMFNSLSKFTTCSTPSFFTNPSLPLFPISPADSPVSPLAPPLAVDPILDQTPDLPLAAPPADSPASPQEPALPVDPVTDQTPLLPFRRFDGHLQVIQTVLTKFAFLRRALYGLKQAPRAWFAKFSSIVHQFGFSSSSHDTALFIRRSDKGMILLLLYVDDMIITKDDHSSISDFKLFLHQQFEMKDLGHLSYFLNLEVSSDSTGYYLSQAKYAFDLLSRAGLTDTKVVSTPLEMNARLTPLDGTPLSDATLYRQLVGSLVYLTVTRPDIAHAVHLVSQFLSALHSTHYAAVIHILRYIKGTLFHGLHFSAHSTLDLCAYSDADWAGDPTDRRSTTGFCFFLGDSLISWCSKKQHIVSRFTTEAEYRALTDTTSELLALRWLLEDMGLTHSSPTVIHCDNRSAIQIAHNDVFHKHTKHIEIDCHLVRHHLSAGILHLLPVSSSDQTADIFTKTFSSWSFS